MHNIDVPILKIHVMKHNSQPIQNSTNCMQNKCYSPRNGCHDEQQFKKIWSLHIKHIKIYNF